MAMRIEILLAERKAAGGVSDQSDKDLIMEIIGRYNDHKANSAIRRWQLNNDATASIIGVICGVCPAARQIIRSHLDYNKWEESGASTE